MLVREAMGGAVATCKADAPVSRGVPDGMTEEEYGAGPVTRHGRLMGIIEREILRSVSLEMAPNRRTSTIR